MTPAISIVIPACNRLTPLRFTLRSAAAALRQLDGSGEILLVDDGSEPSLSEQLAGFDSGHPIRHLRQANQGSIAARDHGRRLARGEYVQFLDSDDGVHPDKFSRQLEQLRTTGADVSYCDIARATPEPDHAAHDYHPAQTYAEETDAARFYIRVQPLPHSPIFRRSYLDAALAHPMVPAERRFDPAGDVWLYFNLAPFAAKVAKLAAPLALVVPHDDARYSHHWEKLGIAALRLMEAFFEHGERRPDTEHARAVLGEAAFDSWRRLPYDFNGEYDSRMLALWRRAPRGSTPPGGRGFQALAALLGPVKAGRLLRRWRGQPYAASRTLPAGEVERLLHSPSP